MIIGTAPRKRTHRVSSDSVWPLRNAEGLTFAEARRQAQNNNSKAKD